MEWRFEIVININDMYRSSSGIYGMGTKINCLADDSGGLDDDGCCY
jgi:hypothetical protein